MWTGKWLVSYVVPELSNELQTAGPYKSREEAEQHMSDIRGYDGVTMVMIYQESNDDDTK